MAPVRLLRARRADPGQPHHPSQDRRSHASRGPARGGCTGAARDRGVSDRACERLRCDKTVPARSRSGTTSARRRPRGRHAGLPHPGSLPDRPNGCTCVARPGRGGLRRGAGAAMAGDLVGPPLRDCGARRNARSPRRNIGVPGYGHRPRRLLLSPAHRIHAADAGVPRPVRQRAIVGRERADVHTRAAVGFPLGAVPARSVGVHAVELRRGLDAVLGPRCVLRLAVSVRHAAGADQPSRTAARHQADRDPVQTA